ESASTSMPCASMAARRAEVLSISRPGASSGWPMTAAALGTMQWAWTSMVFTRLPLTTTSRRLVTGVGGGAAVVESPQPTKARPAMALDNRFAVIDIGASLHPGLAGEWHSRWPPASPADPGYAEAGKAAIPRCMRLSPITYLILLTTLIRLAFAATTGLGVDESYMIAAGREFAIGYFDHPPIAWWLSHGAAVLFGTETQVVVRLPFILLFALSQWLVFLMGRRIG